VANTSSLSFCKVFQEQILARAPLSIKQSNFKASSDLHCVAVHLPP
jgi:hypothetical protein